MFINVAIILLLPALSRQVELPLVFQVELIDPLNPLERRPPPVPQLTPAEEALNAAAAGSMAESATVQSPNLAATNSSAPTAASSPSNLRPSTDPRDAGLSPQPDRATEASTLTQVPQTNTENPNTSTVVDTKRPVKSNESPEKVKPSGESSPSNKDAEASQKAADAQTNKPAVNISSQAPAKPVDNASQPAAKPAVEQHSPEVKVPDKPADKNNEPSVTVSPENSPQVNVSADTPDSDKSGAVSQGPAAGPPGPGEAELNILGDYGDAARKKIRRLVRTPERARENGIKGPVLFEFELDSDGKLLNVKAIESAHKILEQECFEATRVAAPFGKFPPGINVKRWKFRMTLNFPIT
jgi:TonB family protein